MYNKYDIFLKVLEAGSLTKAAELLDYTQSAVSQAVRSLENDLGITLLIRSRTGLSLTPEGKQLLPYIQDIYKMQEQLNKKADSIKETCSGEIRIGAYHLAASHILPKLISDFLKRCPESTFQIKEGDYNEIRSWLDNGSVDFGFMSIQDIKDLECIPYTEDPLYAVFPSDAPESGYESFDLAKLPDYPFIYLDEGKENDCSQIFNNDNITPNIAYSVKEDDTVLAMVENHLGISILPALAAVKHCYDVSFVPTIPSYKRVLGLALKSKSDAPRPVKEFIRFIKQERLRP